MLANLFSLMMRFEDGKMKREIEKNLTIMIDASFCLSSICEKVNFLYYGNCDGCLKSKSKKKLKIFFLLIPIFNIRRFNGTYKQVTQYHKLQTFRNITKQSRNEYQGV